MCDNNWSYETLNCSWWQRIYEQGNSGDFHLREDSSVLTEGLVYFTCMHDLGTGNKVVYNRSMLISKIWPRLVADTLGVHVPVLNIANV